MRVSVALPLQSGAAAAPFSSTAQRRLAVAGITEEEYIAYELGRLDERMERE